MADTETRILLVIPIYLTMLELTVKVAASAMSYEALFMIAFAA